ncbi:MAG: tetraacyldisaccharide 4'-kinase [Betaproteobacteria bacterium]|nr:tetraacyldisaccharide 4'-kinase [Betaproteobacteria bacterium]
MSFWNACWYSPRPVCLLLHPLLIPLSWLFGLIAAARRLAYRHGLLRSERLPVPVIVVGNLGVGGAGKTPLTLWLARTLSEAGYRPGIVSRGYGGAAVAPMPVTASTPPGEAGDEPVLLARRAGCPVWIGRLRAEAGRRLLAAHPEVNVILTDDGLQHYALARDIELAVVDAARGLGNGRLLPAGPLREPTARLARVSAVVCNGGPCALPESGPPAYAMTLTGDRAVNLVRPERTLALTELVGQPVQAIAGIGHPRRFFDHLTRQGLTLTARAFPDHHPFQPADLPAGTVLMTEKDAVKCAAFAHDDCWFLPVDARVDAGLKDRILLLLKACHGPQTA